MGMLAVVDAVLVTVHGCPTSSTARPRSERTEQRDIVVNLNEQYDPMQ
jgi:hypothetical protein